MPDYAYKDQVDFGCAFLDEILEWVAKHFDPGAVYSADVLKDYVSGEFEPEDVFTEATLVQWAEGEGFGLEVTS